MMGLRMDSGQSQFVIARSEATRQSSIPNVELDCRASLAMTASGSRVTVSEDFAMTLGAVAQDSAA